MERTLAGQLTTTEGAVLALLEIEGERSGYDLLRLVEKAIGHVWSPARSGLYATLPRLVQDGLAASRSVTEGRRPEKQLYTITDAGRVALDGWLHTVEAGARDRFFLKLFVGGLMEEDALLAHLEQFTADTEARLAALRAIERTNTGTGHDRYHRFLLELGIERAEHELAWAAHVAEELR